MKARTFGLFAGAILILPPAPGFAATKEVREFPSNSIRPLIATGTSDSSYGQTPAQRRVPPTRERTTAQNPRSCAKPYVARDSDDTANRRDCHPENSTLSQSDIPQLRTFLQPNIQKFAP